MLTITRIVGTTTSKRLRRAIRRISAPELCQMGVSIATTRGVSRFISMSRHDPYPVGTPWKYRTEKDEEEPMTIYIKPSHMAEENALDVIRSDVSNKVLGRLGDDGIYFWERLSNTQYVFPWSDILREYERRCKSLHTQAK